MLVRRYVAARLLARRAQLRFVSCHQQAAFANVAPDLCEHSFVEPCAIDTSMAPARTLARESLGIAGDARIALVIGRLIASKRVDVALSGLTRASALTPIVIGDGPLRASLAAQYPEVTFKGQLSRPETLRWLAAADLLVSASNREGSPTVIREARQLRVPVIAQEVGDLRSWARLDPGIRVFRHPSELAVELARFQGDVGLAP
jgi:glycosyltransferase involved in cell wall biosynthesis